MDEVISCIILFNTIMRYALYIFGNVRMTGFAYFIEADDYKYQFFTRNRFYMYQLKVISGICEFYPWLYDLISNMTLRSEAWFYIHPRALNPRVLGIWRQKSVGRKSKSVFCWSPMSQAWSIWVARVAWRDWKSCVLFFSESPSVQFLDQNNCLEAEHGCK